MPRFKLHSPGAWEKRTQPTTALGDPGMRVEVRVTAFRD